MSFSEQAEKEHEGQKGSVAHFWNQKTLDPTSYFSQIDQALANTQIILVWDFEGFIPITSCQRE